MFIRQGHQWSALFATFGIFFQSYVCNACQDVLMMSIDINKVAVLNIYGVVYCFIIVGISESEAINLSKKCWFEQK